ncbi:MAG: TfoX/Sxy family protein [Hyphomicrobiales bacterium]
MAQPYLETLTKLVGNLENPSQVACKHFFSGAAAYVDGHIFMSLSPIGLALKLPENVCQSLFAQGATPLRYFPKAPIKQGYAVLPEPMIADRNSLMRLTKQAIAHAQNTQP